MPNYKTHSIHGEEILKKINKRIEINNEDIKSFCMGPDAMILTDYQTFSYQHANKTKDFFISMLRFIKKNKLQDNSEVMAYLYGQLDHFVLDSIMHPFIYYMTEGLKSNKRIETHGLVENWIDDYTTQKFNKNDTIYYHKFFIKTKELKDTINKIYGKVFHKKNEALKYSFGMFSVVMYDILARRNKIGIVPLAIKCANTGNFMYTNDYDRAKPFLNKNREIWYNPETGELYNSSFDDLWEKSMEVALETIDDVNAYLYQDKELKNKLILNDTSWNTGLSCKKGQKLKFIKKY